MSVVPSPLFREAIQADMTSSLATASPVQSASDPYETFSRTKVFGSLNGIRALCALVVVKSHAGWDCGIRVFDTPGLGVELFFCISGFLIVTLLIRERQRTGTIKLRNFYARRSLRIFPIYYTTIIAVMIGSAALAAAHRPDTLKYYHWAFLVLLTYTQDFIFVALGSFHPCWSLAMEEQFYLLWPTVEKLFSTAARWLVLIGIVGVSELVDFGVLNGAIRRVYHNPAARLQPVFMMTFTPIALGVCIAHCFANPGPFRAAYRVLGYRWSPLLWAGVLVFSYSLLPQNMGGLPNLWIHIVVMLLLASLVIREDHFAAPLLQFPLLARIGAISYGLYLYHEWVLDYSRKYVDRFVGHFATAGRLPMWRFVLVAILCTLVAELSFRYFEQPILRLRSRFQA